jgi:lipoyl(octanoyl) transferase
VSEFCQVYILGEVPYQQAWDLQNQMAGEIHAGDRPPTLMLLEHPHTYTFGRSGDARNLLWGQAQLADKGIAVHWVDRGGDITYHGPGQLVGYPLLPLGTPQQDATASLLPRADYIGYLRNLEGVLIATLHEFGLQATRQKGMTGVWLPGASTQEAAAQKQESDLRPVKIASIGVKVDSHGISRHGFALNVEPDMSYWQGIVACGLDGYSESSLAQQLSPAPRMQTVIEKLIPEFGRQFHFHMQVEPLEGNPIKI